MRLAEVTHIPYINVSLPPSGSRPRRINNRGTFNQCALFLRACIAHAYIAYIAHAYIAYIAHAYIAYIALAYLASYI